MTTKLFVALYVGLIVGMIVLFVVNFEVAWIFFGFLFVAVFGGLMLVDRPYLIAAGFLLASLIVLGVGLAAMQQSRQVNTWPITQGVITHSWLCTRTTNGQIAYSGPCIDYRYTANGQTFEASLINTGEFAQRGLWWRITGIPDRYRVDRQVNVHYDPGNPGNSRLEPDIPARDWITMIVGAIMAALSAFTLFWVLKFKHTPQAIPLASFKDGQTMHTIPQAKPRRGLHAHTKPDIADQLGKLAQLHEKRAITDEEYKLAKKKLLGSP